MKKKLTGIFILITILILTIKFIYLNDERVYTLKEYSPTGKLLGLNEYVIRKGDTVFQGKFINYNEKGIKISEGQFIDNEPNGICSYYYDNGKKKAIHYRKNSKITLESTFFNTEGLLEKYAMYDEFGKVAFIIKFDEKGATKYNGYFQLETYQYKYANKERFNIKENQYLKVGDKLKYSYIVANIPNTKRSFKIENIGVDDSKTKRILNHIEPCQWDVEEVLTKKGKNTIQSIVRYEFNDKVTPVFTDTLSFDVNVN